MASSFFLSVVRSPIQFISYPSLDCGLMASLPGLWFLWKFVACPPARATGAVFKSGHAGICALSLASSTGAMDITSIGVLPSFQPPARLRNAIVPNGFKFFPFGGSLSVSVHLVSIPGLRLRGFLAWPLVSLENGGNTKIS
jgi:hypothetical protein